MDSYAELSRSRRKKRPTALAAFLFSKSTRLNQAREFTGLRMPRGLPPGRKLGQLNRLLKLPRDEVGKLISLWRRSTDLAKGCLADNRRRGSSRCGVGLQRRSERCGVTPVYEKGQGIAWAGEPRGVRPAADRRLKLPPTVTARVESDAVRLNVLGGKLKSGWAERTACSARWVNGRGRGCTARMPAFPARARRLGQGLGLAERAFAGDSAGTSQMDPEKAEGRSQAGLGERWFFLFQLPRHRLDFKPAQVFDAQGINLAKDRRPAVAGVFSAVDA